MRAFFVALVLYASSSGGCSANKKASCKQLPSKTPNDESQETFFLQKSLELVNVTDAIQSRPAADGLSFIGAQALTTRADASTVLVALLIVVCATLFLSLLLSFASDAKDTGSRFNTHGNQLLGGKAAGKGELQASASPSVRLLPMREGFQEAEGRGSYRGGVVPRTSLPPTARKTAHFSAPPICPSLILPETEARFVIAQNALQLLKSGGVGTMDINGQSGNKLLHGTVEDHIDGRRLSVASVKCEKDPRAVVLCRESHHELYGRQVRDDAVCLRLYGPMEFAGSRLLLSVTPKWQDEGSAMSASESSCVLFIDPDARGEFYLAATSLQGERLAFVDDWKMNDGTVGWRLIVKPGVDAILVLTCMLARILLPTPRFGGVTPSLPSVSNRVSFVGTASSSMLLPHHR